MVTRIQRRSFIDRIRECFRESVNCEFDTVCQLVEINGFTKVNVSDNGMQVIMEDLVTIELDDSFPIRGDLHLI